MSKVFTTFVLGAGLSANYGFPTGPGLIELIINELPTIDDIQIVRTGFKVSKKFRTILISYIQNAENKTNLNEQKICTIGHSIKLKLQESNISSIDSYINEFNIKGINNEVFWINNAVQTNSIEYNSIATYILRGLVFLIISECEKNSIDTLRSRDGAQGTYRFLYKTFFKDKSDNELKNIKIVNFNYDRSFDYVLEYFLKSDFVKAQDFKEVELAFRTRAPIGPALEHPEIIHPYGSLGKLDSNKYGTEVDLIHDKFMEIKVISTERSGFERTRFLISQSKAIIFLGFGFDSTNIENLGLDENKQDNGISVVRYWFTSYKMNNFTITRVLNRIFGVYQQQNLRDFSPEAYANKNSSVIDSISNSQQLASFF